MLDTATARLIIHAILGGFALATRMLEQGEHIRAGWRTHTLLRFPAEAARFLDTWPSLYWLLSAT